MNNVSLAPQPDTSLPIEYPESDGKPFAESDWQREAMMYLISALGVYFGDDMNVYVSGNILLYYTEGIVTDVIAPDVLVVKGIPKHPRHNYKVWEEGKTPDVIIEVMADETYHEDEVEKPKLYAHLGVTEYFQYDPTGESLQPALKGQRLDETGTYQPIEGEWIAPDLLALESQELGLQVHLDSERIRLFSPSRNEYLLTYDESMDVRILAEQVVEAYNHIKALQAKMDDILRGRTILPQK